MSEKKQPDRVSESGLTYDDYAALPDDGHRYELADGVLELMSPSPTSLHQIVSYEIQKRLTASCENDYQIFYAPIDVILSETEVRQPDIVMIHRNRIDIVTMKGIEGAPDLAVEILSPSTLKKDRINKLAVYARFQIPEYWIVDPRNGTLEQYVLKEESSYMLHDLYVEDDKINSRHIPCVAFSMQEIMEMIPDSLKN